MKKILNYFKFQTNEMLLHSLMPTKALDIISSTILTLKEGLLKNENIYIEGKFILIELNNVFDYENILSILSSIYSTGYFVSQYFLDSENVQNNMILDESEFLKYWKRPKYKKHTKYDKSIIHFTLKCEPKWDYSAKRLPEKLYHVTLHSNTEDILKIGLLPHSGKKKSFHPHRVYFCKEKREIENMYFKIKNHNILKGIKEDKYDLLEISTLNLKSIGFNNIEYDIMFYKDENSEGIYTYDLIPSANIKLNKSL